MLSRALTLGAQRTSATARVQLQSQRSLFTRTAPQVSAGALPQLSSSSNFGADADFAQFTEQGQLLNQSNGSRIGVLMAGSPLFFTAFDKPMYMQELPFMVGGSVSGVIEQFGETEGGPLFFAGCVGLTLFRMATYYGFFQPSYLWHFQERYAQSWKVGHHLYGHSLPNPLKK